MNVFLCVFVSGQQMAVRFMVSALQSFLISLTQNKHFPSFPPPPHPSISSATKGKSETLVLLCSRLCPPPSPRPFLCFSSPLTKSLFRVDTAENHMECDITMAGSSTKAMIQQWRDWSVRSLRSEVIRKALWEAHREGESREEWFFSSFFFRFIPTWIIREANEGYTLKGILM